MPEGKALGVAFSEPLLDKITLADGANIVLNTSTGSKIGTSTSQKLAFFNAAPVIQQTAGSVAPAVNPGANTSALVASIQSIAVAAASLANANRTALINLGLIA